MDEYQNSEHFVKSRFLEIIDENTDGGQKSAFGTELCKLNLDSLSFISVIVCLEDEFGISFEDNELDFYAYDSVDSLYAVLTEKKSAMEDL